MTATPERTPAIPDGTPVVLPNSPTPTGTPQSQLGGERAAIAFFPAPTGQLRADCNTETPKSSGIFKTAAPCPVTDRMRVALDRWLSANGERGACRVKFFTSATTRTVTVKSSTPVAHDGVLVVLSRIDTTGAAQPVTLTMLYGGSTWRVDDASVTDPRTGKPLSFLTLNGVCPP